MGPFPSPYQVPTWDTGAMSRPEHREASLDLADEELRALMRGAAELAEREIRATRDGPIFPEPPSAEGVAQARGEDELPLEGESVDELLEACGRVLAAGRRTSPAFFGYVQSPPTPVGVAADLLASAADQNVTSWRSGPSATLVEQTTIRWLGRLVGFADAAAGAFVGGGSAANLTVLLIALRAHPDPDPDRRRLTAYTSDEAHFSVAKAA